MRINNRSLIPLSVLLALSALGARAADQADLGTVTVTGTREARPKAETAASVDAVASEEIADTRPAHPSEIMGRIPGVHVNVTNGEGHMTAIRQPITTGAVYLYLEDGIPIRSTGFFNHNALYEVNLPQADRIEVTKGPGTSLYGSDAVGGVINVMTRPAPLERGGEIDVELGEHGWQRLLVTGGDTWDEDAVRGDLNLTHTDGWRDGTEYDRQSATARWDRFLSNGATLKTILAVSNINQQTAGTSRLSVDDYLNNPTTNYYPISYRDVRALRLSAAYEQEGPSSLLSVTPYVRSNYMEYMPNWSFSYDPNIRETENYSLGVQLKYRRDFQPNRTRLVVGADIEHSPGSRLEHSIDAFQTGDIYTSYTVADTIYDYDVAYTGISPYVHVETSPTKRLRLSAGLRYDALKYDYDNKLTDATIVLNPASMGFPARYNHPGDTTVDFSHLSPKLGATYAFSPNLNAFASYRHAFRAPSEGKLFRPGSSLSSVDLNPVKADSTEVGLRGRPMDGLSYEVSVYHMRKEDDLVSFEDPVTGDRQTVNAGETSHQGIEVGLSARVAADWAMEASYTYATHIYEDWVAKGTDYSGNDMESAPRDIANIRLSYRPATFNGGGVELEWEHLGWYWMDQSNTKKYDGHDLLNLRANYLVSERMEVYGRIMNLTDERYATAARFSRGSSEFAPGLPRTVYAGVSYAF